MKRKNIEASGMLAIKMIRQKNLLSGFPFMINAADLPEGQCYLEYPDGSIQLAKIDRRSNGFELLRQLTPAETRQLKQQFHIAS